MIPFIQSDSLRQFKNIQHGFTTRQGGVSSGHFTSLNTGKKKGDLDANVMENRRRIALTFQSAPEDLITLNQIHGNKVEIVDESWTSTTIKEADALITNTPHKLLGIMTADCVPILLADPKGRVIAAVHAGWRGAVNGIIQNTITTMITCGAERAEIHAAIGPCIWQQSYEVDQNFYENLPEVQDLFIKSTKPNHWLFDLPGFVKRTLEQQQITSITPSPHDTYCHPELFFSFRRKTHLNEPNFGNSLSVIALK